MKNKAINYSIMLMMCWAFSLVASAQGPGPKPSPSPILKAPSRSYVSSTGNDANTCSLEAPCRNLFTAVSKTLAGGEITVLDSAQYGNVTISKAITIQGAPGITALLGNNSITVPVVVEAGDADTVVLRNLHITRAGNSTATRGVQFNSGGALHVENCIIAGFSDAGLYLTRACRITRPSRQLRCYGRVECSIFTAKHYILKPRVAARCYPGLFVFRSDNPDKSGLRQSKMFWYQVGT